MAQFSIFDESFKNTTWIYHDFNPIYDDIVENRTRYLIAINESKNQFNFYKMTIKQKMGMQNNAL